MKKAYISPVASLLMSLSLALGILVSDLNGYRLLTTAHAQGNPCGTFARETVDIKDGLILSALTVRNIVVNGRLLEHAVIAGGVRISDAAVVGSNSADGVIIGSGSPCADGVIIGSGNVSANGVIIGSGNVSTNGVIIGSGNAIIEGVTGDATGTADGGTLTGDNIAVTDGGVVTGQNLLLSGATFNEGSISGIVTSISFTPAN